MLTYRATLQPRSATLSPWQADTLFGHLCWLIRHEEGETELATFLSHYHQRSPPLLFSNGFPEDWLPRPLLPSQVLITERTKATHVAAMEEAKAGKHIRWVSLDEFTAFRRGDMTLLKPYLEVTSRRTVLKNQINRLTGGTTAVDEAAGGGNLYSVEELAFVKTAGVTPIASNVSVYIRAKDETWASRAQDLLTRLARSGYGAKKSSGYGYFTLANWERFSGFDTHPSDANGFISLSNWVPASTDPTDGFYTTLVKYGKLGEELANGENPLKFPLIMLAAGSSFLAAAPLREWYGRLVEGIAPANEHVVQYGYAFAVSAYLATEG